MTPRAIAILASGGGRSVENLAAEIAAGRLDARIALVVSDRPHAGVLDRARRLDLPHRWIDYRALGPHAFAAETWSAIESSGAELVVLAGFLRLLPVPPRWRNRVLNIHPSLLPAFGGKGFYGDRVHAAVLARGVQFTGCTVHFVDDEYDHGRIVLQRIVEVRPTDTVETLGARVFEQERIALPEAIGRVLATLPPLEG